MKNCYLCDKPIIWPKKKISIDGCKKHYFHDSCQLVKHPDRCPMCIEDAVNFFLRQDTLAGAHSAYKKYFDTESLLKKTMSLNNDFLFKYLIKKINTHPFLLQCVANNDIAMFEHVVKHSSFNFFSTYNGKTLLEDLENKDIVFKQILLKKINPLVKLPERPTYTPKRKAPPPPEPVLHKVHPSAPEPQPPSYEEIEREASFDPRGYKNIYPSLSVFISLNRDKMV